MEEENWGRELLFFFPVRLILYFDDNVFKTLEFFLVPEPFIKNRCLYWSMVENATDEKLEPHQNVIQLLRCVTRFASERSLYGSDARGPSEISLYLANVVICRKRTNSRLLVNHLYNNLEKQTSAITSAGHFIIPEEKIQEQSSNVVEDNTYLHISKLN